MHEFRYWFSFTQKMSIINRECNSTRLHQPMTMKCACSLYMISGLVMRPTKAKNQKYSLWLFSPRTKLEYNFEWHIAKVFGLTGATQAVHMDAMWYQKCHLNPSVENEPIRRCGPFSKNSEVTERETHVCKDVWTACRESEWQWYSVCYVWLVHSRIINPPNDQTVQWHPSRNRTFVALSQIRGRR